MNRALSLLLPLVLSSGCVADREDASPAAPGAAHVDGFTIDPATSDVSVLPSPPPDVPTTLTFYSGADLSGASYTVTLMPSSEQQATTVVTSSDLMAHGLLHVVSSVRLACGTRPSRVSLFDVDWSEFSKGALLECDPAKAATLNLSTVGYDDRIDAAALVAHPRSSGGESFSMLFDAIWAGKMEDLPSGATATGTEIWLETFSTFRIYQHFQLDSWACTARDATFDLRVRLGWYAFKPTFTVTVLGTWVASGTGDAWGCHDKMLAKLQAAAEDAAQKLEDGLPAIVFVPSSGSSTYYFAPDASTKDFELFWRG